MPGFWSLNHPMLLMCIVASLWQSMLISTSQLSTKSSAQRSSLTQLFCSDAAHPRAAPPTLALVGAEATCAPLRLQIRNHRWFSDKPLLHNILVALSLSSLPSPPRPVGANAVEEEGLVALECGICYAYRMQVSFIGPFSQPHKCSYTFASLSQPFPIKLVPIPSVQKRKAFSLNLNSAVPNSSSSANAQPWFL